MSPVRNVKWGIGDCMPTERLLQQQSRQRHLQPALMSESNKTHTAESLATLALGTRNEEQRAGNNKPKTRGTSSR